MAVYAPFTVPISPASKNGADEIYYGLMGAVSDPVFTTILQAIITNGIKAALTDATVIAADKLAMVQALTDPAVTAAQTLVIKNALIDPAVVTAAAEAIQDALQDPATDAALIDVVEQGIYNAIDALVTAGIVKFLGEREAALISLASAARKDSVFLQSNDAEGLAGLKTRVDILVTDVITP